MQLYLPPIVRRLSCLLLFVTFASFSYSQGPDTEQAKEFTPPGRTNVPNSSFQARPVPIDRLYGIFLNYLNFLDKRSDALGAQGKDSKWMRNSLQEQLHFTDSDFAPLRSSAHHLAAELSEIERQAKAIRAFGISQPNQYQLKVLSEQREVLINREVANLKKSVPAEKRISLETFMAQFFAPKKVAYRIPSTTPRATTNSKAGAQ